MIFGIWGCYKKQHVEGLLGPSVVCKMSRTPRGKAKGRKDLRNDSSAAGCAERGSQGLWPYQAQCSPFQHMSFPKVLAPIEKLQYLSLLE